MSSDLIDQLDAYGIWLEERCATVLRWTAAPIAPVDENEIDEVTDPVGTSRSSASSAHRFMLVALILVLVGTAAVALWSRRTVPTSPTGLPADPTGALFVLPRADTGMALSDGAIWTGAPARTSVTNAVVVGRPDDNGFVDIVGIAGSTDRPEPPTGSWTEIDTAGGTALVSTGSIPMAIQQRGDRWITLINVTDEQTIGELLQTVTTTTDDGILFDPVDGFVTVGTFTQTPTLEHNAEYTAARVDGTARFTVTTATAPSPLYVALLAERIEPVTIDGTDGWLISTRSDGVSTHGVVWQATPNRIVGVSGAATDEQLIDLAQRLQIVDEGTWTRALPAYSRQGP